MLLCKQKQMTEVCGFVRMCVVFLGACMWITGIPTGIAWTGGPGHWGMCSVWVFSPCKSKTIFLGKVLLSCPSRAFCSLCIEGVSQLTCSFSFSRRSGQNGSFSWYFWFLKIDKWWRVRHFWGGRLGHRQFYFLARMACLALRGPGTAFSLI